MTTTLVTQPPERAAIERIAADVYRLAEASVRFRSLVEEHYLGEVHQLQGEERPRSTPPQVIVHWLSEIRTRGEAITRAIPRLTVHGLMKAAEEMQKAFTDTWDTPDHRKRLAPLRTPVGILNFEGDYKPGELYHRAISGSAIGPDRWAVYESQVRRLGSALRPPHCHIFALGRILAAALYPTCGEYDSDTDSFQFYTFAETPEAGGEAALGRLPVGTRDLQTHLLERLGPRVTQLLRAIQDETGLLGGVVNTVTATGRTPQREGEDLQADVRRRLDLAAAEPCRTGPVAPRKRACLSAEERERLRTIREKIDKNGGIVGMSDAVLTMFGEIYECCVARHRAIQLLGTTGTGKSTLAKFLHTGRTAIPSAHPNTPPQPQPVCRAQSAIRIRNVERGFRPD